jgi:hypothetical protein
MKVARQFIAWDGSKKSVRPVRDGVSRAARELTPKVEERPGDPSNRPLWDGFPGGASSRHFMPGYHRLVPPGQKSGRRTHADTPIRPYAHTPIRPYAPPQPRFLDKAR